MSLLLISKDSVSFPPTLETVPEFRAVLDHKDAKDYILYIHHMCDYSSAYARYPQDERKEKVSKDILGSKSPNKTLQAAVDKYNDLFETDSVKLIKSARKAVFKLREYFDNADPQKEEDPGKSAKDLMANLKSVGDIMKKLAEWEDAIKKEKDTSSIRRGVEINDFNEG